MLKITVGLVTLLIVINLARMIWAESEDQGSEAKNDKMDVINVSPGYQLQVPKGAKVENKNGQIVVEEIGTYLTRRIEDLEKKIEDLNNKIEESNKQNVIENEELKKKIKNLETELISATSNKK